MGGGAQSQPIVATNIAGHTALLIVGSHGTLKAYDALSGALIWQQALPTQSVQACGTAGIAGTALYDATLGEVFVAAGNGSSPNHVVMYGLSVATGAIAGSVDVTPNLVNGEDTTGHTGVTLANGLLYVGTGSNCEDGTTSTYPNWLGRVAAVNPSNMTLVSTFYTVYGQGGTSYGGGGVWSWGGVSADTSGNIYASTGNAETDDPAGATPPPPIVLAPNEQAGYAEHLIKLSANLSTVEDSNYPGFNFNIGRSNLDYTGVPVLFQPPIGSGCSDLLSATQAKGGVLVINDTTNLNPPVATYAFSTPSGYPYYIGNPGYSPSTGLLYAPISSAGAGSSMQPPGIAAIGNCGQSIVWSDQFGPDSAAYGQSATPRSPPTVTSGGVVFMGTPCTPNSSNTGCASPGSTIAGALWAVDANTGTVLNGSNPLVVTADRIWMPPTVDGDWMWLVDNSGNLYAFTIDTSVPASSVRRARQIPRPYVIHPD
jgi:hypothetical protein